jgi:long-chain acyl-CoA synthetase
MLEDSTRKYPNNTALRLVLRYMGPLRLGGTMTYQQLLDNVNRFAAALHALGVRKGDRVALMLPNLPQFVIAFFGTLKLGAIVVNTNPTYTSAEIQHQFADAVQRPWSCSAASIPVSKDPSTPDQARDHC